MKHRSPDEAKKILKWLRWADNDYIAARLLLEKDLITQGVILANTAIEKYLKSLLVLLGKEWPKGSKGHNTNKLFNLVSRDIKGISLNKEFINLLHKAYKLRYPDTLKPGYNIVLSKYKILVELDYSVFEIRKGFKFTSNNPNSITSFDQLKNSPQLTNNNCYYGSSNRAEVFQQKTKNYELRVLKNNNIMEVTYEPIEMPDNGKFLGVALKPR